MAPYENSAIYYVLVPKTCSEAAPDPSGMSLCRSVGARSCFFRLFNAPLPPRGDSGTEKGAQECPKASQRRPQNHQKSIENRLCSPLGATGGPEVGTPLQNDHKSIENMAKLISSRPKIRCKFENSRAFRLVFYQTVRWSHRRSMDT